jgi:SAM-dependent methyltransferase
LRVLFEKWCPGTADVVFAAVMCSTCGFVSHLPRAESGDLAAKYRTLLEWGSDYGTGETDDVARARSQELYAAVGTVFDADSSLRVLDYGGGDGRLMHTFSAGGHRTFLVDYQERPVAGTEKLADTLETLPAAARFDLVVASHVVEHVAEPTAVLRRLAHHLAPGGRLFVEVPMECWGGPPFHDEPVTHINFFVPGSLRRCFEEAGLEVASCRLTRSLHPKGVFTLVVRAIAHRARRPVTPTASGVPEVGAFLQPSLRQRIRCRAILTGGLVGLLSHTFRTRVARSIERDSNAS